MYIITITNATKLINAYAFRLSLNYNILIIKKQKKTEKNINL